MIVALTIAIHERDSELSVRGRRLEARQTGMGTPLRSGGRLGFDGARVALD